MPELLHNAIWASRRERRHEPTLLHLAAAYSLDDTDAVDAARIPVERVGSPILFLSGDADALWPSTAMAGAAQRARVTAGIARADEHRHYPNAGHLIRMPYQPTQAQWTSGIAFGGTPAGLAAAEADAGQQTLRFLASHLGRGTELSASITTPDT